MVPHCECAAAAPASAELQVVSPFSRGGIARRRIRAGPPGPNEPSALAPFAPAAAARRPPAPERNRTRAPMAVMSPRTCKAQCAHVATLIETRPLPVDVAPYRGGLYFCSARRCVWSCVGAVPGEELRGVVLVDLSGTSSQLELAGSTYCEVVEQTRTHGAPSPLFLPRAAILYAVSRRHRRARVCADTLRRNPRSVSALPRRGVGLRPSERVAARARRRLHRRAHRRLPVAARRRGRPSHARGRRGLRGTYRDLSRPSSAL